MQFGIYTNEREHSMETALVIMELGSEWPGWLARFEPCAPSTRCIVQQDDDTPNDLMDRVTVQLEELKAQGDRVDLAVIACNERTDSSANAARRAIARAVLSIMARRDRSALLFTESQRRAGGSRQAISNLVSDLAQEWQDSGIQVSVRFGQPSRPPQEQSLDTDSALSHVA
jgi:hypothetical protein